MHRHDLDCTGPFQANSWELTSSVNSAPNHRSLPGSFSSGLSLTRAIHAVNFTRKLTLTLFHLLPQRSANDSVEDVKMYRNAGATGVLSKNDKAIEVARDLLTKSHTALNMLMSESMPDVDL